MKYLSLGEAETKRRQAIAFLRRLGRDEDAQQFEEMDAREYAEHRGFGIVEDNPRRRSTVAETKKDLGRELDELHQLVDEAVDTLSDAFHPAATRSEMAEAIEKVLDLLEAEEEEETQEEDADGGEEGDED